MSSEGQKGSGRSGLPNIVQLSLSAKGFLYKAKECGHVWADHLLPDPLLALTEIRLKGPPLKESPHTVSGPISDNRPQLRQLCGG